MSLISEIKNGEGSNQTAGVTRRGALKVSIIDPVAVDLDNETLTARKVWRGFLDDENGSHEMAVNASASVILYSVGAQNDRTIFIECVRLLIDGTNFEMNTNDFRRFGSATAANGSLTNGVELFVVQSGVEQKIFIENVVQSGGFYDYADAVTNIVNANSSQSDFLMFDFKLGTPVALASGSTDILGVRINDDLSALDSFRALARGTQELNM